MGLYVKNYRFAPKWYFAVATLFFCALFIHLGFWQLNRAAIKEHLQHIFNEHLHAIPMSLAELPKDTDLSYYPVTVTGHYDNSHSVLLDNKVHAHRVGYEVLTPFIAEPDQQAVLINRGWIPANSDRHILPTIPPITGKQTLIGNIYIAPGKSFVLGNVLESKEIWPLRMEALDIPAVQAKLRRPLYPFIVLLSANEKEGFLRDWQPVAMSADKHRGYAVQWFSFAGVLMIIFFALSFRKKRFNL
jgi:surfeit locus 1 family protein